VVPLVTEAFDWNHGVFLGSIMASETTAAQAGAVGNVRRDPMAMLPFCGYNMADYLAHWLSIGGKSNPEALPRIYYVNWFRKDGNGKFLWPGFGDNSRVLAWVCERVAGKADAVETPLGRVPADGSLNTEGLDVSDEDMQTLLSVNAQEWKAEAASIAEHYEKLGERVPEALQQELSKLRKTLELAAR
ncbi:MAG TPA: phosphoenolpyruvate carboxykinase domain-containing protein, partial [Actinomycetota bacterium]|nr:phosphoenolpyruvate carboxykinase domain-containing protein [Actinomycetota bacterium]